jgi:hypothetical protein
MPMLFDFYLPLNEKYKSQDSTYAEVLENIFFAGVMCRSI